MKKFTVGFLAFASVMAVAGSAAAEGLELGARLAYGLPMGEVQEKADLSDFASSQIPLWFDIGYRINENLFAGAYLSYGLVQLADDACPDGADCSASDIRLGVQGHYHLSPGESIDPWFGLGIGYEMANSKVEAGGIESTGNYSGFEFLNLQGGADFQVSEGVGIGPFLALSIGQYSSYESEVAGNKTDGDIENKGMHEWLMLGVRGSFSL